MLLTEQEIKEIHSFPWERTVDFVRRIESAVLEKLKAQEPMCWTNDTELSYSQFKRPDGELTSGSFWAEYHEDCDIPLYRYPLPPADVVRDAERLDWLMNFGRMVICDKEGCYTYTHTSGRYGPVAKTKREAIDAAMKEMK